MGFIDAVRGVQRAGKRDRDIPLGAFRRQLAATM
jgi:hypothetical protein